MKQFLGLIVKKARKERGLSQKALIKEIGEWKISRRTLQRIEQGSMRVKMELINEVLTYLNITLKYKLRDRIEKEIVQCCLEEYESIEDSLWAITYYIDRYRAVFSERSSGVEEYHIKGLPEFLIYLPLFNKYILNDVLFRIAGNCRDYVYILDKMERLYDSIDDKELREIAEVLAARMYDEKIDIEKEQLLKYREILENNMKQ